MNGDGPYLDMIAAGDAAGLSPRTFADWRWRARHGLPVTAAARDFVNRLIKVGRAWRISERDLQAWLAGCRGQIRRAPDSTPLLELAREAREVAGRARNAIPARRVDGLAHLSEALAQALGLLAAEIEQAPDMQSTSGVGSSTRDNNDPSFEREDVCRDSCPMEDSKCVH